MICNSKTIQNILEKYCFFYDSVILFFHISFVESIRNIKIIVRCRGLDNQSIMVELCFNDVIAWAFSCNEKEAAEVITEGFRFMYDGKWMVDFGDDPDLSMTDINWMDHSSKFIISRECSIFETNIE